MNKEKEILDLTMQMMRFPSISIGKHKNLRGIRELYDFITGYLKKAGLRVIGFSNGGETPSLYCDTSSSGSLTGRILLSGHFDKVSPATVEQLEPKVNGDWLIGRGSADMLTVVATYMVFMKDISQKQGKNTGLLLVGNEEPGEADRWGTPYVFNDLKEKYDYDYIFALHNPKIEARDQAYDDFYAQKGKVYVINFKPTREFPMAVPEPEGATYRMGLCTIYTKGVKQIELKEVIFEGKGKPVATDQIYHLRYVDTEDQGYSVDSFKQEGDIYYDAVVVTNGFTLKAPKIKIKERESRVKLIILSKVKEK